MIPVEKYPTYNFIGLIIGPRGKTQKEMEGKTNCKIAIRGRGSVKEGARGRRDGKMMEGDDEQLHVVIIGDNQDNVDAAAQMITDMLVVIDDDKNVHKQQQLRELALLNGTLKDDEYCPTCGEKGHRAFECPKRFSMNKNKVAVKCALCGDTSHPTRDCKLYKDGGADNGSGDDGNNRKELDSDYLAFMNELDGKTGVDKEGNTSTLTVADQAATVEANRSKLASLVTSIEKTVGGVTTVCLPVPKNNAGSKINNNDSSAAPVSSTNGGSLITTISSRIVKSTPEVANGTVVGVTDYQQQQQQLTSTTFITGSAAISMSTNTSTTHGEIAPDVTTVPNSSGTLNITSNTPGMNLALPPPPSNIPPPPPTGYYGQQQQQASATTGSYHPQQQYGHQQQQVSYNHSYSAYQGNNMTGNYQQGMYGQPPPQQQQQQQQQQGAPATWDYRNFYGSGNADGDAGGFNWWESSS
jgi:splicing factor 1